MAILVHRVNAFTYLGIRFSWRPYNEYSNFNFTHNLSQNSNKPFFFNFPNIIFIIKAVKPIIAVDRFDYANRKQHVLHRSLLIFCFGEIR